MLATLLVVCSLAFTGAWIISEVKFGRRARIALGCLAIALTSSSIWALKDLEYRLFSFWTSQAFEEVSAQVNAGNGRAAEEAIARYLEKVRHNPSNKAAVELIHELNPTKFSGTAM
jgi:hypothetical protein